MTYNDLKTAENAGTIDRLKELILKDENGKPSSKRMKALKKEVRKVEQAIKDFDEMRDTYIKNNSKDGQSIKQDDTEEFSTFLEYMNEILSQDAELKLENVVTFDDFEEGLTLKDEENLELLSPLYKEE